MHVNNLVSYILANSMERKIINQCMYRTSAHTANSYSNDRRQVSGRQLIRYRLTSLMCFICLEINRVNSFDLAHKYEH